LRRRRTARRQLRYRRQIHADAAIIAAEPIRPSVARPRFGDAGAGEGVGVGVGSGDGDGDCVLAADVADGDGACVRDGVRVADAVRLGVVVGRGVGVSSGHVSPGMHGGVGVGSGVGDGVGQSTPSGSGHAVGDCADAAVGASRIAASAIRRRTAERRLI
jgi:hypothetical protein